ncbi:MAG: peptidoglycan bridge formation glycyltransferase FemA/FemB family protein [Chlorobi bacterium]|nr:peptidoglycan bridge formation glycyltransferase FemA/FemB family protein [Chlorobiota bacterium]
MLITTDINKISIPEWDSFIENHPNGTVFQSHAMYLLFKNTKKFKPILIAATNNNKLIGVLLAVIIKEYSSAIGFFTSRTVIYGGPLIDNSLEDLEEMLDLFLKKLIHKVKNKSIFIQFRNFFDWGKQKQVFIDNGFNNLERLNLLVDTSSEDTIRKRMSNSKLRQVKKSLKEGAKVIQPESIEQVNEFYDILYYLYKYKVKKPLPDRSFFANFYEQSKEGDLGVILLIKYQDQIVGGIVSPLHKEKTIYEWYICGLDREFKQIYPSVLATWAAIDYAAKNDIRVFDFMGVGVPNKDYGVREFKKKFGGEMVNFGRFGRVNNKFLYAVTEVGYNMLSWFRKI